jgi:hypothetical protein
MLPNLAPMAIETIVITWSHQHDTLPHSVCSCPHVFLATLHLRFCRHISEHIGWITHLKSLLWIRLDPVKFGNQRELARQTNISILNQLLCFVIALQIPVKFGQHCEAVGELDRWPSDGAVLQWLSMWAMITLRLQLCTEAEATGLSLLDEPRGLQGYNAS